MFLSYYENPVIKVQHTQINITYVLATKQAKYKKHNRMMQSMSF